jgi:hypothetical protein
MGLRARRRKGVLQIFKGEYMDYILRKGLSVCIAAAFIINLFVAEARAEKRIGVLLFS